MQVTVERFPEQIWPKPPVPKAPRITKGMADPRQALAVAAQASGDSYAALSRMIGRREGFLACFIREGLPQALTERDHQLLVDYFGQPLGVRDLWLDRV